MASVAGKILGALFEFQVWATAKFYSLFIRIGSGTRIKGPFYFTAPGKIRIGRGCWIFQNAYLSGHGGIVLGDKVILQNNVSIISSQHDYSVPGTTIAESRLRDYPPIVIEDGVWVSPGVMILPGSHIRKGCLIGAGAVVTRSLKTRENSIYVGNPARFLKKRF
jgi:acetyltransferase-like isoleucine patch superfamily enzyme